MSDASVTVAWVHSHDVAYSWASSMLGLQAHMFTKGRAGRLIAMRCGTGGLVQARNRVVSQFLDGDQDWLFWIDTDMGFEPTIIDRLLEHADPVERPVVGALAFANKETDLDGLGGFQTFPVPTIYRWAKQPDGKTGFVSWHEYPRDELVECEGTGSACILIHRSVFERIREKSGDVWYNHAFGEDGLPFSEDLSFCIRCVEVDAPVHVHTGIKTSHMKTVWLSDRHHDAAMAVAITAQKMADAQARS